jgi:dihydroorotate dehydrogenase (fumarate)
MDLRTHYLGLPLKNPIVASASPLSHEIDSIRKLEDAGASAVVMYSLFEEQIDAESERLDYYLTVGADTNAEATTYFPDMGGYNVGPDQYLELIEKAKEAVDIPIIGSLNGVSSGGWTRYARLIEEAGADALELNIYYLPTDTHLSGADVEHMYLNVVADVRRHVDIPVAVKISPYFSSIAWMARRLAEEGADGLVLFNRFYQPDIDLANLEVTPALALSISHEMRLPLRWAAILYGRISGDLAITSGVHTEYDVLKAMMAGANVAMMASELLKNGVERIGEILGGMERWMQEYEYDSVAQMRGSMSQRNVEQPAAFERANYLKVLDSYRPAGPSMRI